jgi:FkbM family methyltransferase
VCWPANDEFNEEHPPSWREMKYWVALHFPLVYGFVNATKKGGLQFTYSQCGEDLAIASYLPERYGMYVDVGAGHPVIGSNTFKLDKRGFEGIIIEPISKFAFEFKRRNSKVKIYQNICSDNTSETPFFEFEKSFLSTSSIEDSERLIKSGEVLVQQSRITPIRLSDLNLSVTPEFPSFLDIDTEGTDLSVLRSNDWIKFRPRIVLVETHRRDRVQIVEFLESVSYHEVEHCEMTVIFLADEYNSKAV